MNQAIIGDEIFACRRHSIDKIKLWPRRKTPDKYIFYIFKVWTYVGVTFIYEQCQNNSVEKPVIYLWYLIFLCDKNTAQFFPSCMKTQRRARD